MKRQYKIFNKEIYTNKRKVIGIHSHETFELYFLLNGSVKYLVGDEFFYLNSGDLILIPPGILHSTDSESCLHNERLLINFGDDLFFKDCNTNLKELSEDTVINVNDEHIALIEDMFYKIGLESEKENPDETLIKLYISELIIYLNKYKTTVKNPNKSSDVLMKRVADYIFANFSADLSLENLALEFSLSECYLSRRFKSGMGISINQYINYVRVSKAKDLLQKPFGSVTDIALACGFNDSNYFSSVFKKMNGVTPLRYHKRYCEKQ